MEYGEAAGVLGNVWCMAGGLICATTVGESSLILLEGAPPLALLSAALSPADRERELAALMTALEVRRGGFAAFFLRLRRLCSAVGRADEEVRESA